jgi:hypothetical protein
LAAVIVVQTVSNETGSDLLELKVWAGQTLPTLEEHLRLAENLTARAKGGATK